MLAETLRLKVLSKKMSYCRINLVNRGALDKTISFTFGLYSWNVRRENVTKYKLFKKSKFDSEFDDDLLPSNLLSTSV